MATLVCHRIAKEVVENGFDEDAELGEGGAALGAQSFGSVQDFGDALLFSEGGKRKTVTSKVLPGEMLNRCASEVIRKTAGLGIGHESMNKKAIVQFRTWTHSVDRFLKFYVRQSAIPNGCSPRFSPFANHNIATSQAVTFVFMLL